jgi:hypothetical protein
VLERRRQVAHVGREHMVGNDARGVLEPERRQLREDLALVGDPRAEHVIEGRDPVGGDEQQAIAQVEKVPDLTVTVGNDPVEVCVEERGGERHGSRTKGRHLSGSGGTPATVRKGPGTRARVP